MNSFAIQTKYRLFDLIDFVVAATKKMSQMVEITLNIVIFL